MPSVAPATSVGGGGGGGGRGRSEAAGPTRSESAPPGHMHTDRQRTQGDGRPCMLLPQPLGPPDNTASPASPFSPPPPPFHSPLGRSRCTVLPPPPPPLPPRTYFSGGVLHVNVPLRMPGRVYFFHSSSMNSVACRPRMGGAALLVEVCVSFPHHGGLGRDACVPGVHVCRSACMCVRGGWGTGGEVQKWRRPGPGPWPGRRAWGRSARGDAKAATAGW